jgi:deoxyribodipyrimidine photo-lyase
MSREQRTRDNWALLFAQQRALDSRRPLAVVFCLLPNFLGATMRHYGFMLKGLQEVERNLNSKNIPLIVLTGDPEKAIPAFVEQHHVGTLVTDFDPLRIKRDWKTRVADRISIPFYEVDAHNIVPCWIASPKQEYAARTFRPKLHRIVKEFLERFPPLKKHSVPWREQPDGLDWAKIRRSINVDHSVQEVDWLKPGETSARSALTAFIKRKLAAYDDARNDPTQDGQSGLSPYLHFGQLSAQRVAMEVQKAAATGQAKRTFLEELIVRRELSDNFCLYNADYDSFDGFPDWAKNTLDEHRNDEREYVYGLDEFEHGRTHDALWNAAQIEMVRTGKMHGYMRMYWAKKILEWTVSPEDAMQIAIYLNDRYELDGRDPNGYTGIAWSIGGVHDRAWGARPVYGKVRYMSYGGCSSKFDVKTYISGFERI